MSLLISKENDKNKLNQEIESLKKKMMEKSDNYKEAIGKNYYWLGKDVVISFINMRDKLFSLQNKYFNNPGKIESLFEMVDIDEEIYEMKEELSKAIYNLNKKN